MSGILNGNVSSTVDELYEQAIEQIDRGHDAFTVVCTLKIEPLLASKGTPSEWNYKYNLGPHIRTQILHRLSDCKLTEIHRFLETDNNAQTLGYEPEKFKEGNDAPDYSTLHRAFNKYFDEDINQLIDELCDHLREYARESGNLIGSQRVREEDAEEVSERTESRIQRRKTHKMVEQFRDLFYEVVDINLPEEATYEKEDLLDFFLHIAITDDFANNGSQTWKENVDDEDTAPSGDTLRDYIRMFDELEENEVTEIFLQASELLWQIAERRGFLDGVVDVAVDEHAWRFYGDSDTARVSTVKPDRGTKYAYEFLTLSVIGDEGEKFTVAARQIASKQEKLEAVKDLMEEADERLHVGWSVKDRGFSTVLFAQAMKETGVNFLIRGRKNAKTKSMWEEAEDGVNVEHDVEMSRSRPPYESVTVTRIVVPAKESSDDEYMAFITNWRVTRKQARRLGRSYVRRWGIETSYRVTDEFLPKTTSTDFALRQFYYQMAVLLYNVWVLVNAVVAASLGLPEDASPPVTAKYLLTVLRNKHDEQTVT